MHVNSTDREALQEIASTNPFVILMMSTAEAERARSYCGDRNDPDSEVDELLWEMFSDAIEQGPFYDFAGRPFGQPQSITPPIYLVNRWRGEVASPEAGGDLFAQLLGGLQWLDAMGGSMAVHPQAPPFAWLDNLAMLGLVDCHEAEGEHCGFALNGRGRAQLQSNATQG